MLLNPILSWIKGKTTSDFTLMPTAKSTVIYRQSLLFFFQQAYDKCLILEFPTY